MKIKEVLREFGADNVDQVHVGQDVGNDWQKGTNTVKNILDPKRWFGSSSNTSNARVKKQLSNVEVRDALNAAATGKLYQNDIGSLKQILNNLKNGTFKAGKSVSISIQTAINGGRLSPEQSAELQQFAKSF